MSTLLKEDAVLGCLLGGAVGDAIGLPLEGLTRRRIQKLFGEINADFGMRLCLRRGMVSDDTEHALLTLQAFLTSAGAPEKFRNDLARNLKYWFLKLPPGTGLATAKACLKLLGGVSPARSGVLSAGNGPAMRAPILGVVCRDDDELRCLVKSSSEITHTDEKALLGALAIALAARQASTRKDVSPRAFVLQLQDFLPLKTDATCVDEFLTLITRAVQSVESGQSTPDFAASLGLGNYVSGYIYHTTPVVIHAWLSHQNDVREGVLACLRCGGDADSTAAICGGIIGARVGRAGIPPEWLSTLLEWPHGVSYIEQVAYRAAQGKAMPFRTQDTFVPIRNLVLLCIVLAHGFRRIASP